MDLQQRLTEIRIAFETGDTPKDIVALLNGHVEKLVASDAGDKALKVGQSAPMELTIQTRDGTQTLSDLLEDELLVLTWFRGNW